MGERFTLGLDRETIRSKGRRMGSLWRDSEADEGEVTLNEVVDDNLQLKADLLKDWIGLLTTEYELTLEQLRQDFYQRREQKIIQFPGRKA